MLCDFVVFVWLVEVRLKWSFRWMDNWQLIIPTKLSILQLNYKPSVYLNLFEMRDQASYGLFHFYL